MHFAGVVVLVSDEGVAIVAPEQDDSAATSRVEFRGGQAGGEKAESEVAQNQRELARTSSGLVLSADAEPSRRDFCLGAFHEDTMSRANRRDDFPRPRPCGIED